MNNVGVWKTIYEEDFEKDKFLYHYTNIEKAFKILDGRSLKFGRINSMNDTLESKPKVPNLKKNDVVALSSLINLLNYTNNSYIQLLCMSRDDPPIEQPHSQKQLYSDYSGRGFALPRMWAQYADNNNGICLIFDKSKLISTIRKQLKQSLINCNKVTYLSHFQYVDLKMDDVIEYSKDFVNKSNVNRSINISYLLKQHESFTIYNYFTKLDDWQGEKEYRFLAFDESDIYIDDATQSLVGIVVGEKIDNTNLRIIKSIIQEKVEVMKILFTCDGCTLTTTY